MIQRDTCAQSSHTEMCKPLESMQRAHSSSPSGSAGSMTDDAGNSGTSPPSDLDAATLDFSRFRARRIRERLLGLLDVLVPAIERRDLNAVLTILDQSDASRCFPPVVREEAIGIAALPASMARAPVQLYRYYHVLIQLGDEPVEHEIDPERLSNLPSEDTNGSDMKHIAFPDRRPPRGGPRSGPDRRRSGSR
jgi:hypothetical protein